MQLRKINQFDGLSVRLSRLRLADLLVFGLLMIEIQGVRQPAECILAFRVQTLALLDEGNDVLFRPLHRFSA